MTKTRCFFIATSWRERAVPKYFRTLARRLADRGHQVVVFIDGKKKEQEVLEGNPLVFTWPSPRPTSLEDARFLFQKIRQYQPDALLANFGAVNIFAMVGWLARVPRRIVWERTLSAQRDIDNEKAQWLRALLQLRRRLVFAAATDVVANSEATRKDLIDHYRVSASKCTVFHNVLSDPFKRYEGLDTATRIPHRVVCVGRLDLSKGQDVLLRAIAQVKEPVPEVEVMVVGDGEYRASFEALAVDLGIQNHCHFVGGVEHEDVFRHMAQAAVTVVPSRSEAFGCVNAESMAVSTPVIASAVGGIPEIVRDGVDGYLVAPEDPRTLAQKLTTLLQNEALRAQMGRDARRRFLDCFEQSHMLERQVQWLEKLTTPSA